jgi:hypothetical protein
MKIENFNSMKMVFIGLFILSLMTSVRLNAQNSDSKVHSYSFGEGMTFSDGKDYKIDLDGFAQPSEQSTLFLDPNHKNIYNRFRLRRLNLKLSGDVDHKKIEWGLQFDLSGTSETGNASSSILMDAWVAYNFNKQLQITFGQRSTPTDNRELMMSSNTLQLVERSKVTSVFATIREFGLFLDGVYKIGTKSYLKPYLNITNGDGINVMTKDHGGLKFGGRLDFLPFGLFANFGQSREADLVREQSPKLVIGCNLSYAMGVSSREGASSAAILYLDSLNRESLPNFTKYGLDFVFKYRGFSAIGEFVGTSATVPASITQRVRTDGTTSTAFLVNGVQDVSNYVKDRMMLGKGYNIQMGYLFKNKISVDARYTHLEADTHSFMNNGTFYNRPDYYTVGLSKYFGKGYGFKIQGSLTYVVNKTGSNDYAGVPITGNQWIMDVITSVSF